MQQSSGEASQDNEPIPLMSLVALSNACQSCDDAKIAWMDASRELINLEQELIRLKSSVQVLEQNLQQKTAELKEKKLRMRPLDLAVEEAERSWKPLKESCDEAFAILGGGEAKHAGRCRPKYYDRSCEKECTMLAAKSNGCAVVEGFSHDIGFGVGGVEVACNPPEASWIMSTPGAAEQEDAQCKRIVSGPSGQKPSFAQSILKAGWLLKRGRNGGWDRRFFVLESGDQVRSAILRYFDADPYKNATYAVWDKIKHDGKDIILWDAETVKTKIAAGYGFYDGTSCFKIYHFYRDYRFCIEGTDPAGATKARDEWVKLIKQSITFPIEDENGGSWFWR